MSYLGVEYGCKYTLTGADGTVVVFNDATDPNYVGILSAESSGLDAPEVREESADRVEEDGAVFGDFYAGKRPVILQGTIIASSLTQRNERAGKLLAASNALRGNAVLKWKPQGAAEEVTIELRRQQPARITKGYVKEFQLPMVAADARIYGTSAQSATGEVVEVTKLPTVMAVEGAGWTNGNNVKASDNAYATRSITTTGTPGLDLITMGFAIPTTAEVYGINYKAEVKGAEAKTATFNFARYAGGFKDTAILSGFALTTSDKVATKWVPKSSTITLINELNNAANGMHFEATISAGTTTLSVDALSLGVAYMARIPVTNSGTAPAPARFKVYGPVDEPTIRHIIETGGEYVIQYDDELGAGEYVEFNTLTHTAIKNGETNVYDKVYFPGSTWSPIPVGANEYYLSGGDGVTPITPGATKLQIFWNNAWM